MKVFDAVFLFLIVTVMTSVHAKDVELISNEARVEHDGKFHYHFELDDGSKTVQDGHIKGIDPERMGAAISGKYAFVSDDGQEYAVSYTADENGFHAYGGHLPTPPPVPESVLKALQYIADHPPYHPPPGRNY